MRRAAQVVRERVEGDEAAVAGDRGQDAVAPALPPARPDRGAHGRPGLEVAHEHVTGAVGVTGDQVGRERLEGEDAAVGRDLGSEALVVTRRAARADAHQRRGGGLPVAEVDVPAPAASDDDAVLWSRLTSGRLAAKSLTSYTLSATIGRDGRWPGATRSRSARWRGS